MASAPNIGIPFTDWRKQQFRLPGRAIIPNEQIENVFQYELPNGTNQPTKTAVDTTNLIAFIDIIISFSVNTSHTYSAGTMTFDLFEIFVETPGTSVKPYVFFFGD